MKWLLGWSYAIGKTMGYLVAYMRPRLRKRAVEHVRRYLMHTTGSVDEKKANALALEALSNAGVSICDALLLWWLPYHKTSEWVDETGWIQVLILQHIHPERGTLFLTPHLGCFEMAGLWIGHEQVITSMYRPPRQKWLDTLMRKGREVGNVRLVPADLKGVRALLKALKKGESVGMLPDQVPRQGEGIWAPFFGHPAYTMTLLSRLRQQTQAHCVIVVAERLPWTEGIHLHFQVLSVNEEKENKSMVIEEDVKHLNAVIESAIQCYPSQYMWGYNRYKVPAGVSAPL